MGLMFPAVMRGYLSEAKFYDYSKSVDFASFALEDFTIYDDCVEQQEMDYHIS